MLFCTCAPNFWLLLSFQFDNINSQGLNVSLSVHRFVTNLLWWKCWGSRKQTHFKSRAFFNALSHTPVFCMCSTPSRYIKGWSLLCACVQFQRFSLHCFGSSVDLQNLVKIKGVPWLIVSSVYVLYMYLAERWIRFQTQAAAQWLNASRWRPCTTRHSSCWQTTCSCCSTHDR
jgi:hypothetical protein